MKSKDPGVDGIIFPSTLHSRVSLIIFIFLYKFSSETPNYRCGRRGTEVWTAGSEVWTGCISTTNFQGKPGIIQHPGVDGMAFPSTLNSRVPCIVQTTAEPLTNQIFDLRLPACTIFWTCSAYLAAAWGPSSTTWLGKRLASQWPNASCRQPWGCIRQGILFGMHLKLFEVDLKWTSMAEIQWKSLFRSCVQVRMIWFEVDLNGSETLPCGKEYYLEHIWGFEDFGYLKFFKTKTRLEQATLRKQAAVEF